MSQKLNVIAIDGPAGSGKSTVARLVAKSLGLFYIDTGAMYRALTLKAIEQKIDLDEAALLERLSENSDIRIEENGASLRVLLDGKDVSAGIRDPYVTERVKYVARVEGVRRNMVALQRLLASRMNGGVLEGRDIGTVVFPEAAHKFFLDAAFEERVDRRYKELSMKGVQITREDVSKDLELRDNSDRTRKVGPLKKAGDAVAIDTTGLTVEDVVAEILKYVGRKAAS
ncbi:MAG: (d)CMP kinase [Candidatus Omnitrophota bacterium]